MPPPANPQRLLTTSTVPIGARKCARRSQLPSPLYEHLPEERVQRTRTLTELPRQACSASAKATGARSGLSCVLRATNIDELSKIANESKGVLCAANALRRVFGGVATRLFLLFGFMLKWHYTSITYLLSNKNKSHLMG